MPAGRPLEVAGNGDPRGMATAAVACGHGGHRIRLIGRLVPHPEPPPPLSAPGVGRQTHRGDMTTFGGLSALCHA